nr:outer dense fiber protein 2 isoform X1 [Leptinotarsa decemlineata]
MKNRQKLTVSEKNLAKTKCDSETDGCLDIRVRRKISSNPLLQKNINFLQAYNNLFRKPSCNQIGDADSYFRQTLRTEQFDLIRDLNLSHLVRSARSFEGLNKRKPRSKRTLPSAKKTPEHHHDLPPFLDSYEHVEEKELHLKELFVPDIKESDSENDENDYYSPLNELEEVEEVPDEGEGSVTEDKQLEKVWEDIHKLEETEEFTRAEEDAEKEVWEVSVVEEDLFQQDYYKEELNDKTMAEDEITFDEEEEEYPDEFLNDPDLEEEMNTFASEGEEEDEMREVEKMIERASKELQQVVEENRDLMQTLNEEEGMGEEEEVTGEEETKKEEAEVKEGATDKSGGGEGGSVFKYDATIDSAVLKELEDAEKQAKETAKIIEELKNRVMELSKKERMTEEEAKELEEKNQQLRAQMMVFEEKTKRIQQLLGQTNLFEDMATIKPALQKKHTEDILPKVIVCGLTEENIPKILICNNSKKCTPKSTADKPVDSPRTEIAKKLNECYCMQEKLAAENADLEGKRYKLQSDLVNKDQTVEYLQRQLGSLQTELRMVCKENCTLNEKLQSMSAPTCGHIKSRPSSPNQKQKMPCGKGRGVCPADVEARLQEYSENTQNLEKQLGDMEAEVKGMHQELLAVQKEREHLEHHRKMLCQPPPPCPMTPCLPHPCMPAPCEPKPPCSDPQLRELKEQYNRLQDDFKSKLTEVGGLRADNEKLKEKTKQAEEAKKSAEEKLKELETELKRLKGKGGKGTNSKEQMIELEQQLNVAKQRFREAQDELEELRSLVEDQQKQLDDYRNKYLEAQQRVEEQCRQIDLMEMDYQRISEQVNLEIQRVKNQFQEKLQELMPLPDILKSTQMKLQEAQQMHLLAERNNEAIAKELQLYKDKISAMTSQMDEVRSDQQLGEDKKASLQSKIEEQEAQLKEMQEENDKLKNDLQDLQEKSDEFERTAESRMHEIVQLSSQLESVREETARQIARTKDRCEIVRRSMQNQISDLERQLAQSRAMAKAAQKDRDDIRQKMQAQINNLNENFEDAQMRIRNLQGHVNFLKNSYGNVYPEKSEVPPSALPDPCDCSADY